MNDLITLSTLRQRGWNDTLIRHYQLVPDKEVKNPHYRSGPPMKLYAVSRIEPLEKEATFQSVLSKRSARRSSAAKAVNTKKEKLLA
jgi:hypothetical protein